MVVVMMSVNLKCFLKTSGKRLKFGLLVATIVIIDTFKLAMKNMSGLTSLKLQEQMFKKNSSRVV